MTVHMPEGSTVTVTDDSKTIDVFIPDDPALPMYGGKVVQYYIVQKTDGTFHAVAELPRYNDPYHPPYGGS